MGKDASEKCKKSVVEEQASPKYTPPVIEEHNTLEKASSCGYFSSAYVSGYGYYH